MNAFTYIILSWICFGPGNPAFDDTFPVPDFDPTGKISYRVIRVISERQLVIEKHGETWKIHLIGLEHPFFGKKLFTPDPKEITKHELSYLRGLLVGENVFIEEDPDYPLDWVYSDEKKHRTLHAYVRRASDGLFVNLELIRRGYLMVEQDKTFKYKKLFMRYQRHAHSRMKGAWKTSQFAFSREEAFRCGNIEHTMKIYIHQRTGIEFVLIPSGHIHLISSGYMDIFPTDWVDEDVAVDSFLISRCEVTQEQWDAIGGKDNRRWRDKNLPIENVTYEEADQWCRKSGLRLPSEAEWIFASRGGSEGPFCFGRESSLLPEYGWFSDNGDWMTHPVGLKKANAYGLHDLHGNVWEWCTQNPERGGWITHQVILGGGWLNEADDCVSNRHLYVDALHSEDYIGFRAACSIH